MLLALNPSNIKMKIDGTIELPTRDSSKSVENPVSSSTENDSYEYLSLTSQISRVDPTSVKDIKSPQFWKWDDNGIQISNEVSTSEETDKDTSDSTSLKDLKYSTAKLSRVVSEVKETNDTLDKETLKAKNSSEDKNQISNEVSNSEETDKDTSDSNSLKDLKDSSAKLSRVLRTKRPESGGVTQLSFNKRHHKVQDDKRIRKFTDHIYGQTLKAFQEMKQKSDSYTKQQLDTLVKSYKEKFTDFVRTTRQTDIKTREGTRNVLLHIIETSNLMMERIVNFLKANMVATGGVGLGTETLLIMSYIYSTLTMNALDDLGPGGLKGGALRLDQQMNAVKKLEYQHACKNFGVCRSSDGIKTVLLNVISILLKLPDDKLLQINDAATEQLKRMDFSKIGLSDEIIQAIKKNINSEEKKTAKEMRFFLTILYGSLSKSHLPFIVNKAVYFEKPAVKRTISFHNLIDALEEALPATEANKREWATFTDRLKRWADGHPLNIQDILQAFFDNILKGIAKSKKFKQLFAEMAKSK